MVDLRCSRLARITNLQLRQMKFFELKKLSSQNFSLQENYSRGFEA